MTDRPAYRLSYPSFQPSATYPRNDGGGLAVWRGRTGLAGQGRTWAQEYRNDMCETREEHFFSHHRLNVPPAV